MLKENAQQADEGAKSRRDFSQVFQSLGAAMNIPFAKFSQVTYPCPPFHRPDYVVGPELFSHANAHGQRSAFPVRACLFVYGSTPGLPPPPLGEELQPIDFG